MCVEIEERIETVERSLGYYTPPPGRAAHANSLITRDLVPEKFCSPEAVTRTFIPSWSESSIPTCTSPTGAGGIGFMEAARKANAYDFIMNFDDKFDTCARTPNSGSGSVSSR